MESILDIARYFLSLQPMNHKKLQKLCYYAQAWHLALFGKPLMDTTFEAWAHGPVSPELWYEYRDWGGLIISSYSGTPHFKGNQTPAFLDKIYHLYGKYSGDQLEYFTHKEAPWVIARAGYPDGYSCTNVIAESDMRHYYREQLG